LLYRRQGELPRAIAALERGLALCQSADIQIFFPQIASMLATAYVLAGRTAEAVPLLDRMLERVVAGARFLNVALVLAELSEALILADRADDASPLVGRLLEMSRTHPARGYHAHARRLQGELARRRDPLEIDQAATHYLEALALAEPSGMRPLVAHCHLGLGKLYRRLGQGEETEQHLRTAMTMYREMGMQFWLGQAEAEAHKQRPGVSGARRAGRAPV
jgi:tetratricopeptide (TPR) repeat protein